MLNFIYVKVNLIFKKMLYGFINMMGWINNNYFYCKCLEILDKIKIKVFLNTLLR